MRKNVMTVFMMIFLLISLSWGFAQPVDRILVATEEWEDATNADGTGMYFDILRAVYEPEGIEVDYRIVPYARSTVMVQKNQADVMVGAYADELEDVTYPSWYFDADDVSAMFLEKNSGSWGGEAGLNNSKCTYIRGYELNEYIDVPIQVFEVDDRETALKMLNAGRIDYYLDAYAELEVALEEYPQYADSVAIESIKNLNLYMCFQGNQQGSELAGIWDRRFTELMNNGELLGIFEKWDSGDWYAELF